MYRTADADIIHCPVCDVPHRSTATHCEGCSQPLHEAADLGALRRELSALRRAILLGLVGVAAIVGLGVFVGRRVGLMFFYFPPFAWLVKSVTRYRVVRGWVARCAARSA